jgi:hypothetical protein
MLVYRQKKNNNKKSYNKHLILISMLEIYFISIKTVNSSLWSAHVLTYTFRLFGFPTFRISDYLMKVNLETLHTKFDIYVFDHLFLLYASLSELFMV